MSEVYKKTAIITGAAQGIGRAIALRLSQDGFKVVVNDVDSTDKRDKLEELVQKIIDGGRKAHMVTADVSDEEQVQRMVQKTVEVFGGLDVMVANAGVSSGALLETSMSSHCFFSCCG